MCLVEDEKNCLAVTVETVTYIEEFCVRTGWSKSLCAPDDYNTESYK
jgi:hypothetical protein